MIKDSNSFTAETRTNMKGGKGSVTLQHYFDKADFGGQHVRVCAKLIIPPGASIGLHEHSGEDEVHIVLRAAVRSLTTALSVTSMSATPLTGRGKSHGVECIGEETLEILALVVTY